MSLRAILFPILLLAAGVAAAANPTLKEYSLNPGGFTVEQLQELEKTFATIKAIQPQKLRIPLKTYRYYTSFRRLFGFRLTGTKLMRWIDERISKITYDNGKYVAANHGHGQLVIGEDFFRSSMLERVYIIVHEARHSDGPKFAHSECTEFFPYLSIGQPEVVLAGATGCDDREDGAYAFQAALLYEFFAYGLFDSQQTGAYYNSSIARILPYYSKVAKQKYRDFTPLVTDSYEYIKRGQIIERLNVFENFNFKDMWQTREAQAYHSDVKGVSYTLVFYRDRSKSMVSYKEKMKSGSPTFVVGGIVGICHHSDRYGLFGKLRNILIGMGLDLK